MRLEEAIEQNQVLWRELDIPERAKARESIGLGIEALREVIACCKSGILPMDFKLPGETKE